MTIVVNGEPQPLVGDRTVADLVAGTVASPRGIAVAVNGEIVPRSTWDGHVLVDGDRVELLAAHQGG